MGIFYMWVYVQYDPARAIIGDRKLAA
jgi:hypothetical protein